MNKGKGNMAALDPYTFGNSKAAVNLTKILAQIDSRKAKKVCAFITKYHCLINLIPTDSVYSATFIKWLRENCRKEMDGWDEFDGIKTVKSHVNNLIHAKTCEINKNITANIEFQRQQKILRDRASDPYFQYRNIPPFGET